jgi:hypothetical protein
MLRIQRAQRCKLMSMRLKCFLYLVLAAPVLGVIGSSGVSAQPVRHDLDSGESLVADGFVLTEFEPSERFTGGQLHITTTTGFSEWILQAKPDAPSSPMRGWLVPDSSARGWRIETRMQLLARDCVGTDGPGLWVDDGTTSFRVHFLADSVLFDTSDDALEMDTTDAFHVYRLQSPSTRRVQLFVDDVMKLEVMLQPSAGRALMFGDLGGCAATDSVWDYVEYDTFGEGSTGDQDADGIADASDDCVLVADPEQSDGDGDGIGDICDGCPVDADNDADHDGLCAEDDVCPDDSRNDQDNDGVCDTMECDAVKPNSGAPGLGAMCPAICNCPILGIDPVGFDNFLPAGGSGGASAGSGGAGGSTGTGVGVHAGNDKGAGAGGATDTSGAMMDIKGSAGAGPTGAASTKQSHDGGGCALVAGRSHTSGSVALFVLLALAAFRVRSSRCSPAARCTRHRRPS